MGTTPFIGGADALKLLNPQTAQQAASRALIQQLSRNETFQAILEKARVGEVSSGLAVKATKESGVTLTQEQVERLSAAADIAEANGAGRAVFLIDGQALRMDVGTRTVLGPVDMSKTGVLSDIDAVVTVAGVEAQRRSVDVRSSLRTLGMNSSVARAFAS